MTNNLNGLRYYLSYPIEYVNSGDKLKECKNQIISFLEDRGSVTLNPRQIDIPGIGALANRKDYTTKEDYKHFCNQMKLIVRKDLRAVDISDFVVCIFLENVRTTGCIHEIIVSDFQKKPTIIYCPDGYNSVPAWIYGIVPMKYIFSNMEDLKNYLKTVDEQEHYQLEDSRWQFILASITSEENESL